jgi:hypothetical protein
MSRCSICYTRMSADEARTECPDCRTGYHRSCWDEIGGCGSYGCKRAAAAQKPPVPTVIGAGWGDSKTCPACASDISSSLLVCRCGARFPWADPMTREEYQRSVDADRALRRSRAVLIGLFVLSLVGATAPLAGPVAGVYAHRKRKQLLGAGGTYLAMGYGSAAIGACHTLLIALVAVGN